MKLRAWLCCLLLMLAALPAHQAAALSDQDYRQYLEQSPEFKAADQELNRLYQLLLRGLDDKGQNQLRQSQKQWLKQRDNQARELMQTKGLSPAQAHAQALRQRLAELPPLAWSGRWERAGGRFDSANLRVSRATAQGFVFSLEAMSGGNSGQVEGRASLQGDQALYSDQDGCRMEFRLAKGGVTVRANQACQDLAGHGVYFDGQYDRFKAQSPEPPAPKNPQEQALADLVGPYFEMFQDTKQLCSQDDDLDGLGAQVTSCGVRGLFTAQESIVMHTPQGKLWAAVIDGDEVRYFSNQPQWQTRLPRTIDDWRGRFADKRVVFRPGPSR